MTVRELITMLQALATEQDAIVMVSRGGAWEEAGSVQVSNEKTVAVCGVFDTNA